MSLSPHPEREASHLAIADVGRSEKGREITPISPVDLHPLEPVAASSGEAVRSAVSGARAAQEYWRLRPLGERIAALKRAAKEMLRRRQEAIDLARGELGKVEIEALFNEALGPLEVVTGWAKVVRRATRQRRVRLNPLSFPNKRAHVELIPRGVVGVIAPWNYPVAGLYRSTFPALLTGNGVVLKPSEYTPRTSAWLIERLAAELPDSLIQVVQGDGEVGRELIDAGIDACVFTGSPRTGRKVAIQCAERGIPSSIEMGGKDGAIVLADCDLPRTLAGITHWTLSNVGQACGAIEVAYVDERIADDFVERLAAAWTKLSVGEDQFADVGPLGNRRQLEVVIAHVADARSKGARVVCGGTPTGRGLWFLPTVLDHCTDQMSVVQDETFGPVLAVVRVTGADAAIRSINESRYGLGASIWTSDLARAKRLACRLEVGVVTVNNHAFSGAIPALPWSGTRDTGFGVANGPEALSTFVRPRSVIVDGSSAMEPFWMPFDRSLWNLGNLLADAQLGRLGRAWRLPLLLRERARTVRRFFE
jgi:acyl-CoA reductase-like NAD-dependent aldehyde dehydrogenase